MAWEKVGRGPPYVVYQHDDGYQLRATKAEEGGGDTTDWTFEVAKAGDDETVTEETRAVEGEQHLQTILEEFQEEYP